MRLTRVHLYLLGGLILALVGPIVFSQGPDTGRSRGRSRMDPAAFFDKLSGGKDSFNVNDPLPAEMGRMGEFMLPRWTAFLQQKGVTNGVMTRSLFTEYSEEARRSFGKGFSKGGPPPGGAPSSTASTTTPGGTTPAAAAPVDPKVEAAQIEEEARRSFAKTDRNNDGVIDKEEAARSRTLADFDKWDLNKDGKISVEEYIEAYKARRASEQNGGPGSVAPGAPAPPPEEDRKPVVYRAGKLPKELPAWFAQLDKDVDGQVGLYEWKEGGKPIIEFLAMDANGDGFLTVEEVLRFEKGKKKDKQVASAPSAPGAPTTPGKGDATQGRFIQGGYGAAAGAAAGMNRSRGGSRGGRGSGGGGGGPGGSRGKRSRGGPGGGAPPAGAPGAPGVP